MEIWQQSLLIAGITIITIPITTYLNAVFKQKFYNRKIEIMHMHSNSSLTKADINAIKMKKQMLEDENKTLAYGGSVVKINIKNVEVDYESSLDNKTCVVIFEKERATNFIKVYYVSREIFNKKSYLNKMIKKVEPKNQKNKIFKNKK